MRNVVSHLLEDKMDEAVTHYINTHQSDEPVHVESNSLALNVQDDTSGRVVTVMHSQGFSSQMCRQAGEQPGEGPWGEELLDADGRLAALVAHLTQPSRLAHHKVGCYVPSVQSVRGDVDTSVILDAPMRLYNGQSLDPQQESIVVHVPPLPPLPQLQDMKRCQDADWFNNKPKPNLKDDTAILSESEPVLELGAGAGASPANKQHSKKSLPHKKRISRKLKRNNGGSTPQQELVVIVDHQEAVPQEEILPDNFVAAVQHPDHLPADGHHIAHEMRPMFICQLCGEFYGDEQLKFYQHLKQHYEPHATIIIENPVPDLHMDKMTNTCIVDNGATLPDSIVELSLESTVPKTMYPPMDKHILYTTGDKTLTYNKVQYSMANMDKEVASEAECHKAIRKQKQCDAHFKDQPQPSTNSKLEDMGEFSEPEDLMEGIHVAVEEGGEQYEHALLPHLTVDSGHVHQEHVRHWYMRTTGGGSSSVCGCGNGYCELCAPASAPAPPPHHAPDTHDHAPRPVIKDEVLQRIFESEVQPAESEGFAENILPDGAELPPEPETEPEAPEARDKQPEGKKKAAKKFECSECSKVFHHRNSLFYHTLMHSERHQVCKDCGKGFYTASALKIHRRTHNDDRPCKCDECGRDFRQWSDLKYHKASIHSDKKHFKCEFCGKEFARRYSLSVHRRIHTGERNYKCDYCAKTFRASSYRLIHMRTHTGSRPYPCTVCDKAFRVAYDLRRHMVIHDKLRVRAGQDAVKAKDGKDARPNDTSAASAAASDVKPETGKDVTAKSEPTDKTAPPPYPMLKGLLDKKQTKPSTHPKKAKKGAPNVTVHANKDGQLKTGAAFAAADDHKFRVYAGDYREGEHASPPAYHKKDAYSEQLARLESDKCTEERLTSLRSMYRSQQACEETTDGKLQVYTQVEKSKEYSALPAHSVSLSDIRDVVRDRMDGEPIENGFFERLTALYNIPAV